MYFRKKTSKGHTYLQIVEGIRENGKVKQRIIATLGRLDQLESKGQLASLLASGAKCSEEVAILCEHKKGDLEETKTRKIGPPMIFSRLWRETGIKDAIAASLADRRFQFDVEGAIFLTTMHRLMDPGSDRAAEKWKQDYAFKKGIEDLDLHHFYRAMAWLGDELPEDQQAGRTPFSPRCVKDLIEERLFEKRRTLFSEVAVVLFDTTSLYFEGAGGATLGKRGFSKDHRPDLKQMVLGLVIDGEGRPICCEIWPGNTTDVKTILPIIGRLKTRFRVSNICVVADRGMISKDTLTAIEAEPDVEYILGVRMKKNKEAKEEVLSRGGRYREIVSARHKAKDPSPLKIKEVRVEGRRYVVCFNEQQARKDAADRAAILASLAEKLKQGEKAFVGNKGYRRYMKTAGGVFEIDTKKAAEDERYDGKWVLRTDSTMSAEGVALTYKQLWMVEALFRQLKSLLSTRPIYHKCDETIRGHVFSSFLALLMLRELQERVWGQGYIDAEFADVLRDLDQLAETEVETAQGKRFLIRSESKGWCGIAFQSVGVAMPRTLRHMQG